jgi:transcription initiation factor TFIIIB Brf1 subunit/transcription initiation factor TFIIB
LLLFKLVLKELAGTAQVEEKEIRNHYKRLQKVIPEAMGERITSPPDFIRMIVSDLHAPFLLESFAVDMQNRAMNHVCTDNCGKKLFEGKRPSALAAGAILQAATLAKVLLF